VARARSVDRASHGNRTVSLKVFPALSVSRSRRPVTTPGWRVCVRGHRCETWWLQRFRRRRDRSVAIVPSRDTSVYCGDIPMRCAEPGEEMALVVEDVSASSNRRGSPRPSHPARTRACRDLVGSGWGRRRRAVAILASRGVMVAVSADSCVGDLRATRPTSVGWSAKRDGVHERPSRRANGDSTPPLWGRAVLASCRPSRRLTGEKTWSERRHGQAAAISIDGTWSMFRTTHVARSAATAVHEESQLKVG
jgi:hypothetical protein